MKKNYKHPAIEIVAAHTEQLMETISIPTTGHVDNPSFGQGKGMVIENGHIEGNNSLWDD
ncbi:MAG: hypothetical protein J6M41_05965 [Prevotella sp.]|nr:hypothetical protein [Prevotella sp.]